MRTCCFAFVAVLHSSGESPIMPLRSLGRLKIRKLLVDECKSRSNTHFPATAMILLRPDQNGSPTFHRKISWSNGSVGGKHQAPASPEIQRYIVANSIVTEALVGSWVRILQETVITLVDALNQAPRKCRSAKSLFDQTERRQGTKRKFLCRNFCSLHHPQHLGLEFWHFAPISINLI